MKQLIVILFLTLLHLPLMANDGVYYTAGNQLVPLQETQISVKKEILTISLTDNGYANIDVYYEFYNPSSTSKSIKMGFEADPPYNADYKFYEDGKHPYIKDFTVEMNNSKIQYHNAITIPQKENIFTPLDLNEWQYNADETDSQLQNKGTKEYTPFSYVYYFDATFKPGINKVHHTYSYKLSMVVGISWILEYKLSPAARWANKQIDDFTFIIKAETTAKHFILSKNIFGTDKKFEKVKGDYKMRTLPNSRYTEDASWEITLRNGIIKMHITNFKPSEEHELSLSSADKYYSYNCPDEKYHFGAFYDRSCISYVLMSEYMSNVIPIDKKFRQKICRNLPFAHRGHIFKDKQLKKYFENLFWYMPDSQYNDTTNDFTDTDRKIMKYQLEN